MQTPVGTYVALGGSVPLLLIAAAVIIGLRKVDENLTGKEADEDESSED